MISLKELCDKFDSTYELEGRKLNKVKDELREEIENIDDTIIKNYKNYGDVSWLIWMYGQLFTGEKMEPGLESRYLEIKNEMTERNKHLSSTYHLTSMFDVIEADIKYKNIE